ncbi:MAG: hypothetical protein HYR72_18500 [Deltaproteobacteria bacterium]|nr:hypothetical protein [Deltaproteobacteria bacterium]MBI3386288.1 hypothetical protein [Deltaproteobacteria bacterium]
MTAVLTSTQSKPRTYEAGKRRFTLYISWNYPVEAGADVADLDNRFITVLEARRQAWPKLESMSGLDQGIGTQMDIGIVNAFNTFRKFVGEVTGQTVPLHQRVDKGGNNQPLDERVLADTDTLMVISLDHLRTAQTIGPGEVQMLQQFLAREGTSLVIHPHHDVGTANDLEGRIVEHNHHGDWTVSGQQRFSGFARSILSAFDIPVVNQYGLSPGRVKGTNQPAPLNVAADLDARGLLRGVTTFNLHHHLPHYALTADDPKGAVVLARQPINLDAPPHPFVEAGNREFNAMVWVPSDGKRAGDVVIFDFTLLSGFFGGAKSLEQLWRNLAKM